MLCNAYYFNLLNTLNTNHCFETFLIVSPIIVAWMSGVERSGVERVKLEEELQRIA